jgi:hypothetical protein
MKRGSLNISLVDESIEKGLEVQLAAFIKLKSIFRNSCYFDWSYRSISRKSGISTTTLRKCIPVFLEKGWCRVHCGNLVFNKISVVDSGGKGKFRVVLRIEIKEEESYRDLVKRIRILLIERKYNCFQAAKNICRDYQNARNLDSYKKAKKAVERGWVRKKVSCNDRFFMSNESIGKMFGRSASTASRLQKYGREKGVLKVEANIKRVSMYEALNDPDVMSMKGLFFINGKALVQKPNFIWF